MLVSFIIVPILYLNFMEKKDFAYFSHAKASIIPPTTFVILTVSLGFLIYPLSLKLRELTILGMETGFFGDFGHTMLIQEKSQEKIIESMLAVKNIPETISLFVIIAILPALGEELVFRGILQNIFSGLKLNPYLAIIVTAFLFSALHLNLSDFAPRFLLGSVLGLSYYYSKNLLVPIFLHFLNNALSVIYYLSLQKNAEVYDIESQGAIPLSSIAISLGLFIAIVIYFRRLSMRQYGDETDINR
jgi:membrane protease YdiL (CAAX protease family)